MWFSDATASKEVNEKGDRLLGKKSLREQSKKKNKLFSAEKCFSICDCLQKNRNRYLIMVMLSFC